MAFELHTISVGAGSTLVEKSRLKKWLLPQQAYAAGGGAGAAVTLAITGLNLPAKYSVIIGDLGQDATAYVSGRTQTGFTLNIHPRLAANTLAAGNVDLTIEA